MDVDASLALVEAAAASFAASVRALESCGSLTAAQRQRLDEAKRKTQGSDVPATPQTTMSEPPTPQTRRERMASWQQQASANKSHRHLSRSLNFQSKLRLVADAHEEGRSPAVHSALNRWIDTATTLKAGAARRRNVEGSKCSPRPSCTARTRADDPGDDGKQEDMPRANGCLIPSRRSTRPGRRSYSCLFVIRWSWRPSRWLYSNRRVLVHCVINVVVELCFVVDLGLGFVTGYRRGAEVVMDLRLIALNYLRGWFWVDFIASIPLDTLSVLFGDDELCIAKICKFIQMLKICKVFRMLKMLRVRDVVDETIDLGWLTPGPQNCRSCSSTSWPCTSLGAHSGASLLELRTTGRRRGHARRFPPKRSRTLVGRQILFALHWAVLERALRSCSIQPRGRTYCSPSFDWGENCSYRLHRDHRSSQGSHGGDQF